MNPIKDIPLFFEKKFTQHLIASRIRLEDDLLGLSSLEGLSINEAFKRFKRVDDTISKLDSKLSDIRVLFEFLLNVLCFGMGIWLLIRFFFSQVSSTAFFTTASVCGLGLSVALFVLLCLIGTGFESASKGLSKRDLLEQTVIPLLREKMPILVQSWQISAPAQSELLIRIASAFEALETAEKDVSRILRQNIYEMWLSYLDITANMANTSSEANISSALRKLASAKEAEAITERVVFKVMPD